MTEKSYFWDGATKGDADQAPYSAEEFTQLLSAVQTSHTNYVFTGFAVVPSVGMVINIQTGFAFIGGYFFSTTASVLPTVPSNTTGLPRVDRVIIRINKNTSTGRVLLLQGTPGVAPQPAVLSSDPNLIDVSLARIYVPPAVAAIAAYHIIDERPMWNVYSVSANLLQYINENIMPNSEFMAGAGTSYGTAPAMWSIVAGATCIPEVKFDSMSRGSTVKVTCPTTNDGITITVPCLANSAVQIAWTLKLLINISEGSTAIDINGSQVALFPPTDAPQEFIYRVLLGGGGTRNLIINIYNPDAVQNIFALGQCVLSEGDDTTAFIPKKETILFGAPVIPDGYAFTDTILTSGAAYDILLNTEVGGELSPLRDGISALLTRLDVADASSSTGNDYYAALRDPDNDADQLRVEVGRLPDNMISSRQSFVGVPFSTTGVQRYRRFNSNANSVGINHIGCQT